MNRWRVRWSIRQLCRSGVLVSTNRMLALVTASQIASASAASFLCHLLAWHRSDELNRQLDEIPGVGPALATALVASAADPKAFRSGLGLDRASCRRRTRAGARKGSPISANEAIAICAACALVVIRYAKIHGTKTRQVVQQHRPEQCRTAQKDRRKTDRGRVRRISRNPAVRCGSSGGFHRHKPASRTDRFDLSGPRDGPFRWLPANRRAAPTTRE
jgi:hypothetical protein